MNIERFFSTGITYKIPVLTRSGAGGEVNTFGTAVSLLGRIRPMTGTEILASQRLNLISTHVLYCLPEANLTTKCQVYFGSDVYKVKFIKNPMNYDRYWAVDLEMVQ